MGFGKAEARCVPLEPEYVRSKTKSRLSTREIARFQVSLLGSTAPRLLSNQSSFLPALNDGLMDGGAVQAGNPFFQLKAGVMPASGDAQVEEKKKPSAAPWNPSKVNPGAFCMA